MNNLKIGNINLKNPLFLAPMVDVTSLPYRLLCKKQGAALTYTEMLYSSAIIHENIKTKNLMKTIKEEKPIGIQITGNSEKEFEKVIPYLKPYSLVDLNCGCPSIRITGNQAGSYLLKSPKKISNIISILKKSNIPVTAKIRLGFKKNNVLKIAKEIEKAGCSAITVHARLAIHHNKIPADWKEIAKVRKNISIPIIGNGDVFNEQQAVKMLDIADGVMIARAAIGDPGIFSRILYYMKTGKQKEFDYKKNLLLFKEYLYTCKKYNLIDINRIKYIGSSFIRVFEGASEKRQELMKMKSFDEIKNFSETLI